MDGGRTPYARFQTEELILRDYLAAHRTVLANERTFLAYLRTTLTFLIGGVSFIQFFDSALVRGLGWAFIPMAALILGVGSWKYFATRCSLRLVAVRDPDLPAGPSGKGVATG